MYRRFVFIAPALLLLYAPIDNAVANSGISSHSRTAHSTPHHTISPRHRAPGSDSSNENYHSQVTRAKSEWRQSLHRSNSSASF
jgi:hypothetical protein